MTNEDAILRDAREQITGSGEVQPSTGSGRSNEITSTSVTPARSCGRIERVHMKSQSLGQVMFVIAASLPPCSSTHRTGELIEHYSRANCIPVELKSDQPLRTWNHKIKTADGVDVEVFGKQAPGGRISVKFGSGGETEVAANAGDYIYPLDVRIDSGHTHLYIRARGAPASSFSRASQTWLFEYDLRQRRQTARLRVDETVLSPECAPSR